MLFLCFIGSVANTLSNASSENNNSDSNMLLLSGGEGYVDFRIGKIFFSKKIIKYYTIQL